jgi:hypothetical protein
VGVDGALSKSVIGAVCSTGIRSALGDVLMGQSLGEPAGDCLDGDDLVVFGGSSSSDDPDPSSGSGRVNVGVKLSPNR